MQIILVGPYVRGSRRKPSVVVWWDAIDGLSNGHICPLQPLERKITYLIDISKLNIWSCHPSFVGFPLLVEENSKLLCKIYESIHFPVVSRPKCVCLLQGQSTPLHRIGQSCGNVPSWRGALSASLLSPVCNNPHIPLSPSGYVKAFTDSVHMSLFLGGLSRRTQAEQSLPLLYSNYHFALQLQWFVCFFKI